MSLNNKTKISNAVWSECAENLPQALWAAKRWLLWKSEPSDGGKPKKVPYYCSGARRSGALDTPQDYQNLRSLDDAIAVLESDTGKLYAGLGFALGDDGSGNCWQGIDLDALSKNTGLKTLSMVLPGYVELSPSGDGVHAIGYGKHFKTLGSNSTGIEAYSSKRFFTVTCDAIKADDVTCIAGFVESIVAPMHSPKMQPKNEDEPFSANEVCDHIEQPNAIQIEELRQALAAIPSDGREQWQRLGHALKTIEGDAGRELWLEWSVKSEKHDPVEDKKTWQSFKPSGIHWKAVFNVAKECGPNEQTKLAQSQNACDALQGFRFLTFAEILQAPKMPKWLIEDYLEESSSSLLIGKRGTGKSFLALDWALCVSHGLPWLENETNQGGVLYIAGEGNAGLGRRIHAWRKYHEIEGKDAEFFLSNRAADLYDAGAVSGLISVIDQMLKADTAPAMIVVDTLARNSGRADENSNSEMAVFMNNIAMLQHRYGAHVLVVHHRGNGNDRRARGASCLEASVDHVFLIEEAAGQCVLSNTKMKDASQRGQMHFELHEVDWLESGAMVDSAVLKPVVAKQGFDQKQQALTNLMELMQENPCGVSREDWCQTFVEHHPGDIKPASKKKAFDRVINFLVGTEVLLNESLYSIPRSDKPS